MNSNKRIIIGIGVIVALVIIGGVTFVYWQYHLNSEFAKNLECQKLGKEFYYNPESNECVDENYCASNPEKYWCR